MEGVKELRQRRSRIRDTAGCKCIAQQEIAEFVWDARHGLVQISRHSQATQERRTPNRRHDETLLRGKSPNQGHEARGPGVVPGSSRGQGNGNGQQQQNQLKEFNHIRIRICSAPESSAELYHQRGIFYDLEREVRRSLAGHWRRQMRCSQATCLPAGTVRVLYDPVRGAREQVTILSSSSMVTQEKSKPPCFARGAKSGAPGFATRQSAYSTLIVTTGAACVLRKTLM